MTTLVKISDVYLYTGNTAKIDDCNTANTLLANANINFALLNYSDPSQHQSVFDALNTWTFGADNTTYKKVFNDFPILHWTEITDDYNRTLQCANGLIEITSSNLVNNASLVS